MKSLLLDVDSWDLTLDAHANIAFTEEPYRLAQDAACAMKLFSGELYYDTSRGVPYWTQILGRPVPIALIKQEFEKAGMSVPGVVASRAFLSSIGTDRKLHGQLQVTDIAGKVQAVGF